MSKELEDLQEIACIATSEALEQYELIPKEWEKNLALGTFFEEDYRIFELYVAAEKPSDTIVISSARVNRRDRSVKVVVSNLKHKSV
jgi:hypothetical protein